MRGPCLLERKERRKKGGRQKKDEADKRRYRESNILDLSRVQNVAERFRGPSPLISHRIRGISKFPQEWTLGEIWVGELSSRGIATVRLGRKIKSAKDYEVRTLRYEYGRARKANDWWMAYCATNLLSLHRGRGGEGRRNRVWKPRTPNDLLSFLPPDVFSTWHSILTKILSMLSLIQPPASDKLNSDDGRTHCRFM